MKTFISKRTLQNFSYLINYLFCKFLKCKHLTASNHLITFCQQGNMKKGFVFFFGGCFGSTRG
jgi:hypothetical protein